MFAPAVLECGNDKAEDQINYVCTYSPFDLVAVRVAILVALLLVVLALACIARPRALRRCAVTSTLKVFDYLRGDQAVQGDIKVL